MTHGLPEGVKALDVDGGLEAREHDLARLHTDLLDVVFVLTVEGRLAHVDLAHTPPCYSLGAGGEGTTMSGGRSRDQEGGAGARQARVSAKAVRVLGGESEGH